jgi:hypothetical protein
MKSHTHMRHAISSHVVGRIDGAGNKIANDDLRLQELSKSRRFRGGHADVGRLIGRCFGHCHTSM